MVVPRKQELFAGCSHYRECQAVCPKPFSAKRVTFVQRDFLRPPFPRGGKTFRCRETVNRKARARRRKVLGNLFVIDTRFHKRYHQRGGLSWVAHCATSF